MISSRVCTHWLGLLALLSLTTGCKIFDTTCAEDDRGCLGGGLARSGEACIRSGDCASGMDCRSGSCIYVGATRRGGACVATAECEAGTYCTPKLRCSAIGPSPARAGDGCSDSSDCAQGLVCDLPLAATLERGLFASLTEACQAALPEHDSPPECAVPTTCVARGEGDFGSACDDNSDCLAGLYCVDSPLEDTRATTCLGGLTLPREPLSLPSWKGGTCPKDRADAVAYFEVPGANDEDSDFYRLPYPNDVRRKDLGIDLADHPRPTGAGNPDVAAQFIALAAEQPGFATNPVVLFRFSKPFAPGDLTSTTLRIVDITRSSPEYNERASIVWGPPERESNYICPNWLALHRPAGSPLRPGTTYAAIVTRGLRAKTGSEFARSPDFDAMLALTRPNKTALVDAWDAYEPLRDWLADANVELEAGDLLNAAVFTTASPDRTLVQLAAAVAAEGAPEIESLERCQPRNDSPCAAAGQAACQPEDPSFIELHGRLSLPRFQAGSAPYARPEDGGGLTLDDSDPPRARGYTDVCFALSVPRKVAPAQGYPVLLYAHDTGGSFNEALAPGGLAAALAADAAGAALLAIELPQHGARRGKSTRPPADLVMNLQNPAAIRGTLLQGAADLLSLTERALAGFPDGPGELAALRFDPRRIALYAEGQGASQAVLALSQEPRIGAAALAAVGGQLGTLLSLRDKPGSTAALLPLALADVDDSGTLVGADVNPMLALIQASLEDADPINFGPAVLNAGGEGRDLFVIYGVGDSYVPEPSQAAFARAAGLRAVAPDLTMSWSELTPPVQQNVQVGEKKRTVALRQYAPAAASDALDTILDGHFVARTNAQARADLVRFLSASLRGEPPQIGSE